MNFIEMQEMTQDFLEIWQSAGNHLNSQVQGGITSWLRAYPNPPFLEHLSFRLGNQLFFIRIEDSEGKIEGPGSIKGLLTVAKANHGHACLLPMKQKFSGSRWLPERSGWGLIDAVTKKAIDPISLVSDKKIEMTAWELQDMSVQVVKSFLEEQGHHVMSWQGNPEVDPSIWFDNKNGPEWVVVRAVKFPVMETVRPSNWQEIASQCSRISQKGHFASVAIASAEQAVTSQKEPIPLWRGYGMHIRFIGLE